MKSKTMNELLGDSLELDAIKEKYKDYDKFIDYIVSFDDLPTVAMTLDSIIQQAKTLQDTGWVDCEEAEW